MTNLYIIKIQNLQDYEEYERMENPYKGTKPIGSSVAGINKDNSDLVAKVSAAALEDKVLVSYYRLETITKKSEGTNRGALLLDLDIRPEDQKDPMNDINTCQWIPKYVCANLDEDKREIWIDKDFIDDILENLPE